MNEKELNPVVTQVLAGVVTVTTALIISRIISRHLNKKFVKMAEKRLHEQEVPAL